MDKCTIGRTLGDECHLVSEAICRTTEFKNIAALDPEHQQLLAWRRGVQIAAADNSTVCFHHEKIFLSSYENLQKVCSDPFRRHKKHLTSKSLEFKD